MPQQHQVTLGKALLLPFVFLPYLADRYWEIPDLYPYTSNVIALALILTGIALQIGKRSPIFIFPVCALVCTGLALLVNSRLPIILFPSILTAIIAGE